LTRFSPRPGAAKPADLATGQDLKKPRPANARVRDLVERGVADPKRVCIVGGTRLTVLQSLENFLATHLR
jgi:hypothetical protein